MTKFTLTLLDTAGIQDYIFASNRLQENIGASEIVYRATTLWAFEALEQAGFKEHNIELLRDENKTIVGWKFKPVAIEDSPSLQAEVLQAAGGNALILFRENTPDSHANAIAFTKKFTYQILQEAPGLRVLVQHLPFDFEKDTLPSKYGPDCKPLEGYKGRRRELEEKMGRHKTSRSLPAPLLGLSVTEVCSSTGLPAVRTPKGSQKIGADEFELLVPGQSEKEEERERLISRETAYKLAARDLANRRLRHILGEVAKWYDFPADIDNLGRIEGEESYVAIIHADGNGMGQKVQLLENSVYEKYETAARKTLNREYINALRGFSEKLEESCRISLKNVVEKIVSSIDKDDKVAGEIPVIKKNSYNYIPFRPLVFGGDDVTFLCNGQLGVELAAMYLDEFEKQTNGYHACAGVAIVKMHYPFARAYKLAEELTASAKGKVEELFPRKKEEKCQESKQPDCSAIDWHFAQSGLVGSLKNIRKREYRSDDGEPICLRPLALDIGEVNWQKVKGVILEFKEKWADKHNKVIGLREPLRKGADAAETFIHDFDLFTEKVKLPEIVGELAQKTGWKENTCYYFDAIELLDHYVSLEAKS